jgi:hypothetical protein
VTSKLRGVKYRIETIAVPEHGGIAQPGSESRDLKGRRIVQVLDHKGGRLRVLTEEAEETRVVFSQDSR